MPKRRGRCRKDDGWGVGGEVTPSSGAAGGLFVSPPTGVDPSRRVLRVVISSPVPSAVSSKRRTLGSEQHVSRQ